jgi:hypothetical protein
VTVCCSDPEGEEVLGHIDDGPLHAMLNGERMQAFRRAHFEGRFPQLCAECGEYETDIAGARFEQ